MQLTFGNAEGQRKRTRREIFLAEMEQVVPWKALLALIEPHYPKHGRPGRQPYRLATMLRIHFLQQWYALSDPTTEEALCDTPVMLRFAGLGGLYDIPDETTTLDFRRLLETHGLAQQIFGGNRLLRCREAEISASEQVVQTFPNRLLKNSLLTQPWTAATAKQARKRLICRERVRACTGLGT